MNILFYLNTLFIVAIISFIFYIITDKGAKYFIGKNKFVFIFILTLALIYKLPFDFSFFQGLEYEDSYLANSVSRYLLYNNHNPEPFLATTSSIGSLKDCHISSTHSGNLIGFPTILWTINNLCGYDIKNVAIINLLYSIISALSIYLICYKLNKNYLFGLIASIVFITCPIFNSFHTSSLFETSSSSLIVLSLFLFILYFENKFSKRNSIFLFFVMIIINLISIHFKRENIIILSFPFVYLFIKFIKDKKEINYKKKEILLYAISLIGIVLYYIYVLNIYDSLYVEREYAKGNSFQLKFFIPLIKMFFKGFSDFRWFYFYSILSLLGVFFIIFNAKKNPLLLYPLIIFIAFVLINSIHHRSYYFVRSGEASAFESLRHINMLSPFFSIISGYGIFKLFEFIKSKFKEKKIFKLTVYSVTILTMTHMLILSYNIRYDLIQIEKHNRIDPITTLLKLTNPNKDIIITDQSILLHNYCQDNLSIIEFTSIGKDITEQEINRILKQSNIYFLRKQYFNESVFRNRYQRSIEVIEKYSSIIVAKGDGYEILRLVRN